jgi:hypothetical protein
VAAEDERLNRSLGRRLADWCAWTPERARVVLLGAAALAVVAAFATTRVRVDDSWMKNLPPESVVVRGDNFMNERMAGTTTLELMIDSGRPDGILQPAYMSAMRAIADEVAQLGEVGAVDCLAEDVARVVAAWRGASHAELRQQLRTGQRSLSREDIAQAALLLQAGESERYRRLLDESGRRARLTVFVRQADYPKIERVTQTALAAAKKHLPAASRAAPFGDGWISYLTVGSLVKGQAMSLPLALLTDFLLLSWLFKSPRAALSALCPLLFSLLAMFAFLAWSQTPLGIANSMFAGITLGIGLDFSIHLTTAYRTARSLGYETQEALRQAWRLTGPAIITSALAISAGFAVLLFSSVTPNRQLGLMICLSLLVCALATLTLLPALVSSRRKVARPPRTLNPEL